MWFTLFERIETLLGGKLQKVLARMPVLTLLFQPMRTTTESLRSLSASASMTCGSEANTTKTRVSSYFSIRPMLVILLSLYGVKMSALRKMGQRQRRFWHCLVQLEWRWAKQLAWRRVYAPHYSDRYWGNRLRKEKRKVERSLLSQPPWWARPRRLVRRKQCLHLHHSTSFLNQLKLETFDYCPSQVQTVLELSPNKRYYQTVLEWL